MLKTKINLDEYFMAMAKLSSQRSKDPNTKVGACIVNNKKKVIGLGYNAMPKDNDIFTWTKNCNINNKYKYVIHAEINAILDVAENLDGATIYVSLFPCNECAKTIAQSGITEVVYDNNKYKKNINTQISFKILYSCNIKIRQLQLKSITI